MHADLGDLELALARRDGLALDVALETETEQQLTNKLIGDEYHDL